MLLALSSSLLSAVLYLFFVRLIDANEKEPWWAMLLAFAVGAGAAAAALPLVPASVQLSIWSLSAVIVVVKFVAVVAVVGALVAYGARRGWEEMNGTMDGIVYGTAVGLGFGLGQQLLQLLTFEAVDLPGDQASLFAGFGARLLQGLADAIPAALMGAGLGAATRPAAPLPRVALPIGALGLGAVAELGYATLRSGNALGGVGLLRARVASWLPVLVLLAIAIFALWHERRTIRAELSSEAESGLVPGEDLALLTNPAARAGAYLGVLARGQLRELFTLRAVHNLQVQLAFVKERARTEHHAEQRARAEGEVARVRQAISERRDKLRGGRS